MITWDDMIDSIRLEEVIVGLDIGILEVRRGEHWASCPLPTHPGADQSPSFSINEDTLLYNCFTCNEGGPLPLLVASLMNFESDAGMKRWDKALMWLLPYSDGDVDSDTGHLEQLNRGFDRAEAKVKKSQPRHEPMPYFSDKVIEKLEHATLDQLAKWNITDERTIEQFSIRFDPERYRRKNEATYTGPALVIPHYFEGNLVGYQERWLEDDRPKWVPKYTNSEDFPKALTLFNWDGAREEARRGTPVIVVESTLTVVRLWELGYAAVATFGASVRDEQIRLLRGLGSVILAFDDDPDYVNDQGKKIKGAGKKAVVETANKLFEMMPVEKVTSSTDDKSDLADLPEETVHALIQRRTMVTVPLSTGRKRAY